ncbi:TetR/AcrR family transcriptional regulator [Rhodococcus sp. O3]|uniref:TetR/AcrR family transcriptional regulator n=1 Tax=Rhodococcus sp. O3 TaxID=3404919 RepID=UPI003B66B24D
MESRSSTRSGLCRSTSLLERAYSDAVEPAGDTDTTRTRLLDAAYDQFCRMGIQRSTMEDVAKRANLSRITIYRKFDTKESLVDQVILREFSRYFTRFIEEVAGAPTVADRVTLGFVSSLRTIRTNPLVTALIETDPTSFAGSIIGANGEMLSAVQSFVAGQLRREQASGTVAAELDVDLVAEMMVRITGSFLAFPSRIVDLDDDTELTAIARRFLVPMLQVPQQEAG